jgi:branched-chain amino acid transport system substrate-binding protein
MHTIRYFTLLLAIASAPLLCASQERSSPVVVIGQTANLHAPNSSLSTEPLIGVRALIASINNAGGVNGRRVELRVEDDGYDAGRAADNVKRFVDAGAVAVLMPIGTVPSVGALKAAGEFKIPLIGPYSGAPSVAKSSDFLFPTRISFEEEYGRIVSHLLTIGITNIGFAYADNPGGKFSEEVTRKLIERQGYKMVKSVAIKLDGSDAQERAKELATGGPAAVVMSLDNRSAGLFVPAYRATGVPTSFYSFSVLDGKALYERIGANAVSIVISQVVPYPWGRSLPILTEYREAMRNAGAANLSYGSLEGYINAKIVVEGIRRAGPQPTKESVRRGLESMTHLDLGGVFVTFSPQAHLNLGFSELTQLGKGGLYVR